MRALVFRSLVGLLALSFAASGVAAHYCNTVHHSGGKNAAVAQAEQSHHGHGETPSAKHAHQPQSDASHQHASGHLHEVDNIEATLIDDAACSKCCGICTLVTGLEPSPASHVIFKVSAATFSSRADLHTGAPQRIDPGIPKRLI